MDNKTDIAARLIEALCVCLATNTMVITQLGTLLQQKEIITVEEVKNIMQLNSDEMKEIIGEYQSIFADVIAQKGTTPHIYFNPRTQ